MIINRPTCEYYAFAGLPYHTFEAITAVYALFYQITHIPYEVHEPSVAHQKCLFYQNDIGKMLKQQATHPLCIALQHFPSFTALADWQPIITATQMDIDRITFYNEQDFERYAHKKYGALYQLIGNTPAKEDSYKKLGYFIAQVIRLQRLRQDTIEQQHIPRAMLTQHHIEAWQLEQDEGDSNALILALINQALANASVPDGLPQALRLLHRLYRDILVKMHESPETLLTRTVDTLPIKKLWVTRFQRIML